jgi:cation transport ATPase
MAKRSSIVRRLIGCETVKVDAGFHAGFDRLLAWPNRNLNMKKAILEVGGMLSVLDFLGVEKRLKHMPGVHTASVNIATNTAVVAYDEKVNSAEALRAEIIDCGFRCCGEVLPKHICETQKGGAQDIAQDAKKGARR